MRKKNSSATTMKTLKVGIASRKAYKARTLAIARGEYVPEKDEPKVWLEPEVLRVIGEESKRNGTNKQTSRQIDRLIQEYRAKK